jgi:crotonobetainyl-CoA:carnitine CoA-transferase CaiB-like acyl-CoA transferase
VVELGSGIAPSWCGKVLADLGADVVKVEPPEGDHLRTRPGTFAHLGTNKRSVVAASGAAGAATVLELVDGIDLVIEAPGSGALADWAVDRDEVMARRRSVTVVSITGFGAVGPYAGFAWSDLVVQAFAGTLTLDRVGPVKLPLSVQECTVGHTAALGALAAVLRARATGEGAFVDVAAVEAIAASPTRMSMHLGWEYRRRVAIPAQQYLDSSATLLPLGLHPCADGYVSMMMTPQQLGEMLDVLDSDVLREAFARPDAFVRPETKEILDGVLYPWLFDHTRAEITELGQSAGWPVAPVHRPRELLSASHLHQRGFWVHAVDPTLGDLLLPGAPYRFTEGGWHLRSPAPPLGAIPPAPAPAPATRTDRLPVPAAATDDPDAPPLRGIRVIDFTTVWSGPLVTMHLADLGAEVIRIENPRVFPPSTKGYAPRPDFSMLLSPLMAGYASPAPEHPDRPYNRHAMNNCVSRNKRSCTLDVRDPEQRELFLRLAATADVFVENMKSTTLHQLGIHETELLAANPRMIILRIPPAGLSGDWSGYTGFGGQFDGLTGFASLVGNRGTELIESPATNHMDTATGPAGAFAVLAALHYRAATGRGQVIELAQSENILQQMGDVFVDLQFGLEPERLGNRDAHRAPQGLYRCADDRLLALTVTDDDAWRALTAVIDRPDLGGDARLEHLAGRKALEDVLDEAVSAWTATVASGDAFRVLQRAGVAAAPVLDVAGFADDPHVRARDWIRPLSSRDVGTFDHLGPAFRGIPLAWHRGSPALGEDNEYVYRQLLGLDDPTYRTLVARRVATEDYLDADGHPC